MNNNIAPAPARPQLDADVTGHRSPGQLSPGHQVVASALLELDLEVAQGLSRRVGPPAGITAQKKELAAAKRANRSTLNEIAASLGVSRSTANAMFEEPLGRSGGRVQEERAGDGKRHDHGTGRRRHAGVRARRRGPFLR